MALAYLCVAMTRLPSQERRNFKFQFHPYIVDHRSREGSSEEAILVAERVEQLLGVQPKILPITWPPSTQLATLPNFESEARRLRYQALGQACRNDHVSSLLLAHHSDDQAETVLIRLANGHRAAGLQGIRSSADIPECLGLHGIHGSGGEYVPGLKDATDLGGPKRKAGGKMNQRPCGIELNAIQMESGGIKIYRPLLSFPKEDLIMTCTSTGVEWVEDATNRDPTLTVRNAARKLLKTGRLPRALQKASLLQLAMSSQTKLKSREDVAERYIDACNIVKFDNRVGLLSVQLSEVVRLARLNSSLAETEHDRCTTRSQSAAVIFLRKLVEVVSPENTTPLKAIQAVVDNMIWTTDPPMGFTAARVKFERFDSKRTKLEDNHPLGIPESRKELQNNETHIWTMSREPYRRWEPRPTISIPYNSDEPHLRPPRENRFELWDGRFWIRVENNTRHLLIVRPFTKADLKPFLAAISFPKRSSITKMLKEVAPGDIRWTLPTIALADPVGSDDGISEVLALPSLGVVVDRMKNKLRWQIRYKRVNLNINATVGPSGAERNKFG